jgi:hypothetical protein
MPKVDIMLAIVQAAMTFGNNPQINKVYADLCFHRSTLFWICERQDDNGDKMAAAAVQYASGHGEKPTWMTQAGL